MSLDKLLNIFDRESVVAKKRVTTCAYTFTLYEVVNELPHLYNERSRYIQLFNKLIANNIQCCVVFIMCRVNKTRKPSSAFHY